MAFRILLLGVIVAAVACSDGIIDPAPAGGALYVLRTIDGHALPAEYAANPDLHGLMVADTLELSADGYGSFRGTVLDEGGGSHQQASLLSFETSGNTIEVSMVCPPNALANCLAGPHYVGRVLTDGIVFNESTLMRAPLVFDRVR